MNIELKPCPFCGGEAYLRDFGGSFHSVCCWNRACAMTCETPVRISAEKAITDWNTRVERTCHDSNNRFNAWQCSECGATMLLMFDDFGEPTFSVNGVADVPHYCPNCGAKVAEE